MGTSVAALLDILELVVRQVSIHSLIYYLDRFIKSILLRFVELQINDRAEEIFLQILDS